jgi:Ca-activated chloride channel family protein
VVGAAPATTGTSRMAGGAQRVALLLLALFPALSGFSFFERPSPDVEEGNRQLMRGNAQAALLAYERALGVHPEDPRIHYNRGTALLALGRMPEAEKEFSLGAQSPDGTLRADSFYNLGNAHLQQSRLKEAIDAYKRALVLRPGDRHAKWNLEFALRKLHEQEEKQQQKKQEQQPQAGQEQQQQQQDSGQKDPSQQAEGQQPQDPSTQAQPAGTGPDAGSGANRPAEPQQNQPQQNQPQQNQLQQNQPQQDQPQQNPSSPEPRDAQGRPEASPPPSSASPGTTGQGQGQPGQAAQAARAAGERPPRDTERQDAEAVLEAFEAVEPTVQKDLARRRAGNRRPRKDW